MSKTKKKKDSKNDKGSAKKNDKENDLKDQLSRALADYDNLRKRVEKEKGKLLQFANKGLIGEFLTIYDMLENAQEHINDSGIAIILEEFRNILWNEGVEKIEVEEGDGFNEELFEAVEAVEPKKKSQIGKVAEVTLSGWKYKDGPVVREAKVKVYRK